MTARHAAVKSSAYKALYVTVTGTAHQTNGDILALSCSLNGNPCDSYGPLVRVANMGANSMDGNSPMLTAPNEEFILSLGNIKPGKYPFHCTPHLAMNMKGEITVQ